MEDINRFTPITFNKGTDKEFTFNTDKEYYDYCKNNPDFKPMIKIGEHGIPMQIEQYLTIEQ